MFPRHKVEVREELEQEARDTVAPANETLPAPSDRFIHWLTEECNLDKNYEDEDRDDAEKKSWDQQSYSSRVEHPFVPLVTVSSPEGGQENIKLHNWFTPSAVLVPCPFECDKTKNGVDI